MLYLRVNCLLKVLLISCNICFNQEISAFAHCSSRAQLSSGNRCCKVFPSLLARRLVSGTSWTEQVLSKFLSSQVLVSLLRRRSRASGWGFRAFSVILWRARTSSWDDACYQTMHSDILCLSQKDTKLTAEALIYFLSVTATGPISLWRDRKRLN